MENAIAEAVGREEAQVGFWINFLSLITGVSPMIGLLGTVSGMIGAFQKIGMGGMGKPELLASNIGEALITTATGLCIAIPAMFAYFIFRNNLSRIVREAESEYSAILDALTGAGDFFASSQGATVIPPGETVAIPPPAYTPDSAPTVKPLPPPYPIPQQPPR
jgi:biopolymer transport protein ExbB